MNLLSRMDVAAQAAEAVGDWEIVDLLRTVETLIQDYRAIIRSYRERLHSANEQALTYQTEIDRLRKLLAQAYADVRYAEGDHR